LLASVAAPCVVVAMATEEAAKPSPIPPYPEVRPLLPARFLFCFFSSLVPVLFLAGIRSGAWM
jgi:hypothetical protein